MERLAAWIVSTGYFYNNDLKILEFHFLTIGFSEIVRWPEELQARNRRNWEQEIEGKKF